MTWVDAVVNAAVSFVVGVPAGFVISRRARRAGFAVGRRIGFEEGKAAGWRGANEGLAETLAAVATHSEQKARAN